MHRHRMGDRRPVARARRDRGGGSSSPARAHSHWRRPRL
jgi:hypothetical protein